MASEMGCSPSGSIHLCAYELVITLGASMAWFREGRGRERLEDVHVERCERGALLLGELDEAVLAGAAAGGAARALARALVVRPLVVGQALGPGARRAAALALGHLRAGQARLRRRLLLVLLHLCGNQPVSSMAWRSRFDLCTAKHVAATVGVDADGQHEGLVACVGRRLAARRHEVDALLGLGTPRRTLDALVALELVLGLGRRRDGVLGLAIGHLESGAGGFAVRN